MIYVKLIFIFVFYFCHKEIFIFISPMNKRDIKSLHYISGILITIFIGLHLFNHAYAILGVEKHVVLMSALRKIYRNPYVEPLLLGAVVVQVISGIKLLFKKQTRKGFYDKLHVYSGLYLAFFLVIHVSAVLTGRFHGFDTNFYYSATTLNFFPFYMFFFPYYILAIFSFFGHIAAIHYKKMKKNILSISPLVQANLILLFGTIVVIMILLGQTNFFMGVSFPSEYIKLAKSFL